ncbi:MAG: hypothetical protein DI603_19805 [Roseateles depolymerans]|uniref:Uncharacterized protein n=1 Tax=Roseateles depolymerans TaxID=76731 RepID=A0A2W5DEJ8_9BURK|nr:MAG: hypothetical protein DI603_19805 [Roseateles depolymerans]
MKTPPLFALLWGACCQQALADDPGLAGRAQAELRAGCAQNYASYLAYYPLGTRKSYLFAGERFPGDTRHYSDAPACSEAQYALYLDKADPALVMSAYPSGAGRPRAARPAASAAPAASR